MLIRLVAKHSRGRALDYDLVDLLRTLCRCERTWVLTRDWSVSELDLWTYQEGASGDGASRLLFPELAEASQIEPVLVSGERLLERSAVVHQFESGLFLRVVDPALPVQIAPHLRLWHGPATFQATNVDLEIRCDEAGPYEIVSLDPRLIECLGGSFAEMEEE
jgi:hypothetical protein